MERKEIFDFTKNIIPYVEKIILNEYDSFNKCHKTAEKANDNSENGRSRVFEIFDREIAAENNPEIKLKYFDKLMQYDKEKDESQAKTVKFCYEKDAERRMQMLYFAATIAVHVAVPLITQNTNLKIPVKLPQMIPA